MAGTSTRPTEAQVEGVREQDAHLPRHAPGGRAASAQQHVLRGARQAGREEEETHAYWYSYPYSGRYGSSWGNAYGAYYPRYW